MTAIGLRPATAHDLEAVLGLLREATMPTGGVEDVFPAGYVVAVDSDGNVVGAAGLERRGDDGFFRSLVVAPAYRRRGVGRLLVDDLLRLATRGGLGAVYLLTTDAADYFVAFGFHPIARESAPQAVRTSPQFTELCPSTATCMRWSPGRGHSLGE